MFLRVGNGQINGCCGQERLAQLLNKQQQVVPDPSWQELPFTKVSS